MPGWREWWGFDFVDPALDVAGWAELVLFPEFARAWYHAFVVGRDRQLVAVVDHAVPLPVRTLELRTHGLWADHICETPGVHWTLGLEAFAVGLDDPAEMYRRQLGDVVPLGFDLEWESDDPDASIIETLDAGVSGYSLRCDVNGDVLIGPETVEVAATGTRHHRWGTPTAMASVDGRSVGNDELVVTPGDDGLAGRVELVSSGPLGVVAQTPVSVPDPLGACRRPRAVIDGGGDRWFWIDWTEPVR